MITETSTKTELLTAIDEAVSQLNALISPLDENQVNSIPYEDSWTAGQLFRHVSKSIGGMAKAMQMEAKPAERDPGEKIAGLKKTFLDFSTKMKSPDFIVPEEGPYKKQAAMQELNKFLELLKENSGAANLNELVEGLPLGPITKLELLHFCLYHTQRHLQQMEKIADILK